MASPTLDSSVKSVGGEWERVALGATAVVVLLLLGLLASHFLSAMKAQPESRGGNTEIASVFGPNAFDYLDATTDFYLPAVHAFSVRPPPGFRPPRPVRPPPEQTTQDDGTDDGEVVVLPPIKPIIPDPPEREPDPPPPVKPPEPPPIRHFVTYNGFMTLPSSDKPMALMQYERTRGKDSRRETEMLGEGGSIKGLQIESFDEQQLVLKPRDGDSIVVRKGERTEIPQ